MYKVVDNINGKLYSATSRGQYYIPEKLRVEYKVGEFVQAKSKKFKSLLCFNTYARAFNFYTVEKESGRNLEIWKCKVEVGNDMRLYYFQTLLKWVTSKKQIKEHTFEPTNGTVFCSKIKLIRKVR